MTIKCLAFDLDGTLLLDGSKKSIQERLIRFKRQWHKECI